MKKILLSTVAILFLSPITQAQDSDNSLVRYTCFRTIPNNDAPTGKVVIFQQLNNDNISGRDFNTGDFSTIVNFSVQVFSNVPEVQNLPAGTPVSEIETRNLSDRLLSQVNSVYHENNDNYLEYQDATAQRRDNRLALSWNNRKGGLRLNNGFGFPGIFMNTMENFSDTDQGTMICNPPDFITNENETVLNEETPTGTQVTASNAVAN